MIQFLAPGVPQVYYVGLLAGENDLELLARTGVGRDVNRHHYTPSEIEEALDRPVVRRLCELIRLRNTHRAFGGQFSCGAGAFGGAPDGTAAGGEPGRIWMRWDRGDDWVLLDAQTRDGATGSPRFNLSWSIPDGVAVATHSEELTSQ